MDAVPLESGNNMHAALGNLSQAFKQSSEGGTVDPNLVNDSLTTLFNMTNPKTRAKNPDLLMIFQKCGPLAKDPKTNKSLITNPQMLQLIDPEKYKKGSKIKRGLVTAGLGIGILGAGTGVVLADEIMKLKAQGGPTPIEYNGDHLFNKTDQIIKLDQSPTPSNTFVKSAPPHS